jgi:predicted ATPase/class 3 adenylate cyclase
VSHDGPVPDSLPIGTVTFMFTDIEGSTRLLQGLGETPYRDVLERHAALVRHALVEFDGVEVSTEGDAFFAVFRSSTKAVLAAVSVQRMLAEERWPDGHAVRVRIGLHTGEGRIGGDSYVGLDVHRAARIGAAGHGGQILLSNASRALVETSLPEGVTLRDMGTHRLKDLDQSEHLAQLVISGLDQEFPTIRTLETPSNLPVELTTFIGRQSEVDEASALLATIRLLTLTGPGGTGKTRLALRIAAGRRSAYGDGVFFVDLAPLTDPALVAPAVARSLGLSEQPQRPIIELLKEHLESREVLLVLDNFEHLLAAGEVVEDLLAAAPRLKVLVTSRSSLNLYGEQEFPVPPLTLPDPRAVGDLERLSQYEAVALFIERARAAKPAFRITKENAPGVAEICVRLDGLPLAIELAASRVRVLEPGEIQARLEQRLPLLTTGASNLPERQRTLRGAIAWSYELLDPPHKLLFGRLAIFAGGCTLEAAEAICNPGGELGLDSLDGMASLVDQNLVRRMAEAGETRFGMLETIREYGRERLEADSSLQHIGRRHILYFKDLAKLGEQHFLGPDQISWLDRFEREHDNVRAALSHAVVTGQAHEGLQLAAAVWRFWFQRGYLREGRAWLAQLIELQPDSVSAGRAKAFVALGGLTFWLGDADATELAYETAQRLYGELGDREAQAETMYNLAFVPVMRGDLNASRERFRKSLAIARDVGRADLVAKSQLPLGITLREGGDPNAALSIFQEAVTFFRETNDRLQLAWALGEMATTHHAMVQGSAAWKGFLDSLGLFADARNLPGIGGSLEIGSLFESAEGRHVEAVRLTAAGAALRETTGAASPRMFTPQRDVEDAARRVIGDEAVENALAEGRRMTLDEAIDYARNLAKSRADRAIRGPEA